MMIFVISGITMATSIVIHINYGIAKFVYKPMKRYNNNNFLYNISHKVIDFMLFIKV